MSSLAQEQVIVKPLVAVPIVSFIQQQSQLIETSLQQKDTHCLAQLLHKDLLFGHSNGWTETKESLMEDLLHSKVVYLSFEDFEFSNFNFLSDSIISFQKTFIATGKYKGEAFRLRLKALEVWICENKTWQLFARQSVDISLEK